MPPSIIAPKVGIFYLFKNVPRFTKFISIAIVIIPILYRILSNFSTIEFDTEFNLIAFYKRPWTLFTFPFFQPDLLSILFLPLIHFISCKYFEPQWTSKELLFFWFFINVSSALATSFIYTVAYTIKQKPDGYELIVIRGLLPILAAFTVAYKQAIPEYKIKLFKNFIGFKLKQLPGLFLVIILVRSLILRSFQYLIVSWFGIFISWVYLRFFKVQDSIRGDRSETFSFVSFFPAIMRPPLKILSNSIYALLVKLRLCRPIHRISSLDLEAGQFHSRAVFPSLSSPTSSTSPTESNSQNYDRRRAMALKALDERLKTSQLSPILESKSNPDESS